MLLTDIDGDGIGGEDKQELFGVVEILADVLHKHAFVHLI
jgi:hypothetical protein